MTLPPPTPSPSSSPLPPLTDSGYQSHPGLPNGRLDRVNDHFPFADHLIDPAGRLVLCAIPKNGCTALKRWFLSFVEPDAPREREVHKRCRDHYSLALAKPEDRAGLIAGKPRIAFVRDPVRRLASVFADKFVRLAPLGCFEGAREMMEQRVHQFGRDVRFDMWAKVELGGKMTRVSSSSRVDYERGLTFSEFVRMVCSLPDRALDPHWRPQSAFLAKPVQDGATTVQPPIDRVRRIQNLAKTLNELSKQLGLNAEPVEDRPMTADAPEPKNAWAGRLANVPSGDLSLSVLAGAPLPSAAALYNGELVALVEARYADDLRLWRSLVPDADERFPGGGKPPTFRTRPDAP